MSTRAILLFLLFYIVPIGIFGYGLYSRMLLPDLIGLIWIISAFVLNLMKEQ